MLSFFIFKFCRSKSCLLFPRLCAGLLYPSRIYCVRHGSAVSVTDLYCSVDKVPRICLLLLPRGPG